MRDMNQRVGAGDRSAERSAEERDRGVSRAVGVLMTAFVVMLCAVMLVMGVSCRNQGVEGDAGGSVGGGVENGVKTGAKNGAKNGIEMPHKLNEELNEEAPEFLGENAYVHAGNLVAMGPRPTGSSAYEESLKYMEAALARYGWETRRQTFTVKTPVGERTFTNLRARLKNGGKGTADWSRPARGVVSGHVDTKVFDFDFVGANDGASHTGVLLELARVWGRETPVRGASEKGGVINGGRVSREGGASTRSGRGGEGIEIVFFDGEEAFGRVMDGEEDGLFGSKYYVKTLKKEEYPQWMVNADMVGGQDLRIRIPADTGSAMYGRYLQTREKLGYTAYNFGVAPMEILDDHVPFAEAGIPVLNIIGDFRDGNWWHTPRDTMSLLSPKSLGMSGRFLFVLIDDMP